MNNGILCIGSFMVIKTKTQLGNVWEKWQWFILNAICESVYMRKNLSALCRKLCIAAVIILVVK